MPESEKSASAQENEKTGSAQESIKGASVGVLPWVVFTSFIFLMTYQARAIFGPLLSYIEAEFGIGHEQATRLQLFISLGYSASMFATVYTATLIRYRYLAGLSCAVGGVMLAGVALCPDLGAVSFLCVLLGVATGQYFTAGMGTLRSLVTFEQWSKAVSIHEFGPNLCFFLCPLAAVWGASLVGWRGVLVAFGLIACVAGLSFIATGKGGNDTSPPFFFKGLKRVLRNPLLWLFVWLMGICIGGQFGPYSVMMLHLTEDAGFSGHTASWLLSTSRMLAPAAVLAGGFATIRFGSVPALIFCFAAHSLSLLCLAADPLPLKLPGLFIQPMMGAMSIPPLFTHLAERFPARKQAMVLALGMPLASFAGTGAVPYLLGISGAHASFSAGFACMGGLAGLSALLLVAMRRGQKRGGAGAASL